MKTSAFIRYRHSADVYKSVLTQIGDSESASYYFAGRINLIAGMNSQARMIIRCEQPFALGTLFANLKDNKSSLILDDIVWQVNSLQPVVDAFGNVEEYRMSVIKYQGTI